MKKTLPKGLKVLVTADFKTVYKLYATDIVTVDAANRSIELNSGGWRTNHTRKCINLALNGLGLELRQVNFNWYILKQGETKKQWIDFVDGMRVAA